MVTYFGLVDVDGHLAEVTARVLEPVVRGVYGLLLRWGLAHAVP